MQTDQYQLIPDEAGLGQDEGMKNQSGNCDLSILGMMRKAFL